MLVMSPSRTAVAYFCADVSAGGARRLLCARPLRKLPLRGGSERGDAGGLLCPCPPLQAPFAHAPSARTEKGKTTRAAKAPPT